MNAFVSSHSSMARGWCGCLALCIALCITLLASAAAHAQQDEPAAADAPSSDAAQPDAQLAAPGAAQGEAEARVLRVHVGRSQIIDAPWPVSRVAVTAPEVADVQVLTPRQVLVQGQATGVTDLLMWSEDEQVWQATVIVDADLRALSTQLNELFPGAGLRLGQAEGVVTVAGTFRRAEEAAQLAQLLEATGIRHVDMTRIAGVQQVMVQVRVAEASRTAFRRLGVDFFATGNDFFGGSLIGGGADVNIGVPAGAAAGSNLPFSFLDSVNVSPGVTLFAGVPDADFQIFLQALAENQYLRILAEPNLVALSGEEASFLAGGEVPVTVAQAGPQVGAITVEFKEFGVRLRFRPVVLGDGAIRLTVAPEVSEVIDVQPLPGGGLAPTLVTRRAETTLQLNSGQTFAMAGLLSQKTTATNSRVPWLGEVPILGSLFRSVRYQQDETELVVLVTARLIEPVSAMGDRPLPGSLHVPPTDWELYVEGRIEAQRPPRMAPQDAQAFRDLGLNRLRGTGAWTNHQTLSRQAANRNWTRTQKPAAIGQSDATTP